MLYLAEVQKKTPFIGRSQTLLKLFACQPEPNQWRYVVREVILATEANNFKDGVLVFVELNADKQVQHIQEAARELTGILINFSELQENYKNLEEIVEQWRQSLCRASRELSPCDMREMELKKRRKELQEAQEWLEKQQQEIEIERQELARLRQEREMPHPRAFDAFLGFQQSTQNEENS